MADLLHMLEQSGAILKGRFKLSSGRESDTYFEKFRILEKPAIISEICSAIAERFKDAAPDFVVGPTTGGIIIAFEVARQMDLPAVYVEREGGHRVLRRGATLPQGARVLLVDDVLTTGKSLLEVISILRERGAELVAVAVMVDRSESELDFGSPLFAAVKVDAKTYAPNEVPDWLSRLPLTEPGSRNL